MGKPLSTRQKLFIELLPKHAWDMKNAAIEAGYTPQYAHDHIASTVKKNKTLGQAVEVKRKATEAKVAEVTGLTLEQCGTEFKLLYDMSVKGGRIMDANTSLANIVRMQGGFIDKTHNINTNIEVFVPMEPEERREWLLAQLILIDRQLAAGTALAGDDVISVCAKGPETPCKAITGDKGYC